MMRTTALVALALGGLFTACGAPPIDCSDTLTCEDIDGSAKAGGAAGSAGSISLGGDGFGGERAR